MRVVDFTEMFSGSEAGSCFRLIDFVYHSTLGLRVIQKKGSWTEYVGEREGARPGRQHAGVVESVCVCVCVWKRERVGGLGASKLEGGDLFEREPQLLRLAYRLRVEE